MPSFASVSRSLLPALFVAAIAALPAGSLARAQAPAGQAAQPAPPKPYKVIPVKMVPPFGDPAFAAFRKELAGIAAKKDRAALAKVTAGTFFWMGPSGDKADKKKSGIDNLAAALDLDGKDDFGWQALTAASNEPTLQEVPERKGTFCSPAMPTFDEAAADAVAKETGTEPNEWGYVVQANVEVRGAAKADAPVIDKLGQNLVRVMPDPNSDQQKFLRIVTPAGKVGYVDPDLVAPLGTDQICYIKDASGWKIAGYAGND